MNLSHRTLGPVSLGLAVSILLAWFFFFYIVHPLPFFAYFFDPECSYYLNSLQLSYSGSTQLDDHPGTFLLIVGAAIARFGHFTFENAFDVSEIERFRSYWHIFSLFSSFCLLLLISLISGKQLYVFVLALLILIFDYNALAYWGTFTPEGAFFILYLPIALIFLLRLKNREAMKSLEWFGWFTVLAALTTLKITLWPVTIFIWGVAFIFQKETTLPAIARHLGTLGATIIFSFGLAALFSDTPERMFSWFASFFSESGRYGKPLGESSGAFLEGSAILAQLQQGLSLQNYTVLLPLFLFIGLAVYDLKRSPLNSKQCQLSALFLVSLGLVWLAFLKHPYQIKYLLPQVLLMLVYWLARETIKRKTLSGKIKLIAILLMAGVAFSAFANFLLLHAYSRVKTRENVRVIDWVIQEVSPSSVRFSLEVLHPDSARAFALRECKIFTPVFQARVSPTIAVFRERDSTFKRREGGDLPFEQITDGMLIISREYFEDARAPLIHSDEDLDLFFYYP